MAWADIDSAPRDGERIVLVNLESGYSATGHWEDWKIGEASGCWVNWAFINGHPTHWTELPAKVTGESA